LQFYFHERSYRQAIFRVVKGDICFGDLAFIENRRYWCRRVQINRKTVNKIRNRIAEDENLKKIFLGGTNSN